MREGGGRKKKEKKKEKRDRLGGQIGMLNCSIY